VGVRRQQSLTHLPSTLNFEEKTMSTVNRSLQSPIGKDLERVIEPLASYICATRGGSDEPGRYDAFSYFLRELGTTNSPWHLRDCMGEFPGEFFVGHCRSGRLADD
jgi:hypothetical protein